VRSAAVGRIGGGVLTHKAQAALACFGAEVVFASANWRRPQLASGCPTSADLTIAFVHSVGLTDALTASLEKCVEVLGRRIRRGPETAQDCRSNGTNLSISCDVLVAD
jgi:hypothetical protein